MWLLPAAPKHPVIQLSMTRGIGSVRTDGNRIRPALPPSIVGVAHRQEQDPDRLFDPVCASRCPTSATSRNLP